MGSGLVPENARINSFVVGAYTDAALCPSGIYHSITGIYCLIFGFLITLEIHYVSTNRIFAPARQFGLVIESGFQLLGNFKLYGGLGS